MCFLASLWCCGLRVGADQPKASKAFLLVSVRPSSSVKVSEPLPLRSCLLKISSNFSGTNLHPPRPGSSPLSFAVGARAELDLET